MHPIEYPINTIEMVSKIPPDTVPIINLVETNVDSEASLSSRTNVVSKDYLSKLLTTYKTLSREEIISTLRLIVSKKERLYDLLYSNIYLDNRSTKYLRSLLYNYAKKRLKSIKKLVISIDRNINKKDNFYMMQPIDRTKFPKDHILRNSNIPVPTKKSPWWMYTIDSNPVTRNAYLQVKDLIILNFIEHNKIFAVRMDFYVPEDYKDNLDKINKSFNSMMINLMYQLDYYLDFVCVREYSEKRGIHLHCLFLLNGNKVKDCIELVHLVSKYWSKQFNTEEVLIHCSNLDKDKYPDKGEGLGLIEYWEYFKIEKLIQYCKYIIKDVSEREWLNKLGNGRVIDKTRLFSISKINDRLYQIEENNRRFREEIGNNRKYLCCYDWIYSINLRTTYSVFSPPDTDKTNEKVVHDIRKYIKPNPRFTGKEQDTVTVPPALYYSR